ncbi:hypothetical protein ACQPUZ_19000 [Clostridium tertium]
MKRSKCLEKRQDKAIEEKIDEIEFLEEQEILHRDRPIEVQI